MYSVYMFNCFLSFHSPALHSMFSVMALTGVSIFFIERHLRNTTHVLQSIMIIWISQKKVWFSPSWWYFANLAKMLYVFEIKSPCISRTLYKCTMYDVSEKIMNSLITYSNKMNWWVSELFVQITQSNYWQRIGEHSGTNTLYATRSDVW